MLVLANRGAPRSRAQRSGDPGVPTKGEASGDDTAERVKYVRVTISANFGNMLSMAVASAFLPFLALLPRQILLLNLLSDIPRPPSPPTKSTLSSWPLRAVGTSPRSATS